MVSLNILRNAFQCKVTIQTSQNVLYQDYFCKVILLFAFPRYKQKLLCENKVKSFDQRYISNSQQNREYNLVTLIPIAKMLSIFNPKKTNRKKKPQNNPPTLISDFTVQYFIKITSKLVLFMNISNL